MIAFIGSVTVLAVMLTFSGGGLFAYAIFAHGPFVWAYVSTLLGTGWLGIVYGGLLNIIRKELRRDQ